MNVDTTSGSTSSSNNNGNNMPPTSVKELSELLHSNRKNHQAAMRAARVEFRSSLKELTSATEKQEKRKSFQAASKANQESFKESQGATRKSYFSSLDSEKERMVARSVLKKLMEQLNENNNENNNGGGDDDCDMTDNAPMKNKATRRGWKKGSLSSSDDKMGKRKMFREEMKSFRQEMNSNKRAFRASLKDLSPDEKSAKRKMFREEMHSKKHEFRTSLKDFRATLKDLSPDEKSTKRKMFRRGMKSKTKEFRAMKEAHQAEMRDARKKFQKLPQEEKGPKRQLFKAEMELKKRVFQTTLWAETRKVLAGNDGLSAEEKDALTKVQELLEFFVTQRTAHEAAVEAHREAFQAGLYDGMSDSDEEEKKKKKRKAFQKEIQAKRQAFMADMLAIQQAAFSRLKEAKSMNNACEIMENLCLHDDSTGADAEDDADGAFQKAVDTVDTEDSESKFEAKKVEDSSNSGARKVVLKKMVTGKNAIRAHACPRKVFRASLQGLSREEKKAKWHEHQAVTQATRDEVRSDIAEFKLSLDGLSDDEKAKKWQTRLEEVHARFVEATRDGTDTAAIRLAHVEMNQNRRAANHEGMFKKGMFKKALHNEEEDAADDKMQAGSDKMEGNDEEMDGKAKFEPPEEFKKDLEDFATNLQGLSSQEQKIQWKNRIQELQSEVHKARMMVAMTRKAQREVLKAGKSGGDTGEDFEMVVEKEETDPMTGKDDEIDLGDEAFEEVHVEGEPTNPISKTDPVDNGDDDADPMTGKDDEIDLGDEAFEEVHVEGEPTNPISKTEPVDNGDDDADPMTGKDNEIDLGDEAFEEVHVEGEPTKPISETEPVDDDFVVCA